MKLDKNIINETINYINSLDLTDSKKEEYISCLRSYNKGKKIKMINENILFMFTTPLAPILAKDKIYSVNFLKELSAGSIHLLSRYIEYIGALSKWVDLKEFFNQEHVLNYIENSDLIYGFIKLELFINNLSEENKKAFYYEYIKRERPIDLRTLANLPDEVFDYAYDNLTEDNKEKIKNSFINSYLYSLSKHAESRMLDEVKEKIITFSISDKMNFINRLANEKNAVKAFYLLDLEKNLDLIVNDYYFDIKKYVSQELLFEKFVSQVKIDRYEGYLRNLNTFYQLLALPILVDNNKYFSRYKDCLNKETLSYVFDSMPQLLDDYDIYKLYYDSNDIKYLKYLKEDAFKHNKFRLSLLCEDEFVKMLTEEEKQIIIKNIESEEYIKPNIIVPGRVKKYNDYFFRIYVKTKIDELEKNPTEIVKLSPSDLFKYYTDEEISKIIKHVDLGTLISAGVKDEYYDKILSLLKKDRNLLKKVPKKIELYELFISSTDESRERFNNLLNYIDESDYPLLISRSTVEFSDKLKDFFINNIDLYPNMVNDIYLLNLLDDSLKEKVLEKINIKCLIRFSERTLEKNYIHIRNLIIKTIEKRIDEYVECVDKENGNYFRKEEDDIYFYFDDNLKNLYINKSKNITTLISILVISNEFDDKILDRILQIFDEFNITMNKKDTNLIINNNIPFKDLNDKLKDYIISKMNFNELLYTYTYYNDEKILNIIINKIHENVDYLFDESVVRNIDILIHYINKDEKNYINNCISNMINSNDLYSSKYKDKIKSINLKDSINYLYLYKKGYIVNNQEILDKLLDSNPFLFKTVNSVIFNDKLINLDYRFINKVSKYSDIQQQLKLISFDEDRLEMLYRIAKYLEENITNEVVYDKELSMIIDYIEANPSFKISNHENMTDIINYILCNYPKKYKIFVSDYSNICDKYDIAFDNFTENKKSKCDELFDKELNIDEMKNLYLNKYFSLSLEDASNFYQTYVVNYEKVIEYSNSDLPLLFINLLTKIVNIKDPVTLRELYYSSSIYFDLTDVYEIESIMSHAYTKALSNDYKDKQKGTKVNIPIKDLDGNINEYEMTELVDDFGLIVHSTCAYGEMPLIDNDYYNSWNYNPNTENHGICCCYITNTSYGTAAVTGNGVMLGFTSIKPDTVVTYSPYDLVTVNNGFNIQCLAVPFYTKLDEMSDYTRHTHNEINLERRVISGNDFCLQPSCIVIFNDMDDNNKANSIKAYNDFKKHNNDIKLIYIDRVKIATNESSKLENMINEYIINKDLNLLKDIINKYESLICCSDFISIGKVNSKELIDMDELFKTDMVTKLLFDTIDEINLYKDKDRLLYLISILEHEQYKFDLIDDKNPDRKHIFKLYSKELKEKLNESMNLLDVKKENTRVI